MLDEGVVVAGRWPQTGPDRPTKPLMMSDKKRTVLETFMLNAGAKAFAANSDAKNND